jgi:galactokinase
MVAILSGDQLHASLAAAGHPATGRARDRGRCYGPQVSAQSAAALFSRSFGRAPAGVWSAPGRVNLIGEHTDYNAGLCLPIALPHRTFAAVARRSDSLLRVVSAQGDGVVEVDLDHVAPGHPAGWAAYVAGVPWALREAGYAVGGLDVAVDGSVPLGAGLSSSAALECAVGAAASDLFVLALLGSTAGRPTLAAVCVEAENTIAQAPTGGMDQSVALLASADHALLIDCRDQHTEQVPFHLAAHDLTLLVIDTRAEHALVDGQYAERRKSCEQAARELDVPTLRELPVADLDERLEELSSDLLRRRARHVVTEIDRVQSARAALQRGSFVELGQLFVQSHASMRDDFEISVPELDTAVEATLGAGALGSRMTGGGFGGSAIALLPDDRVDRAVAAVAAAFEDNGFRSPDCFPVTASAAARRER